MLIRLFLNILRNLRKRFFYIGYKLVRFTQFQPSLQSSLLCNSEYLRVNFSDGRTVRGIAFNDSHKDLMCGVADLVLSKDREGAVALLADQYKVEHSQTIDSLFNGKLVTAGLEKLPIWCFVVPWSSLTISSKFELYPQALVRNRGKHGLTFAAGSRSEILAECYSDRAAASQVDQFFQLNDSIERFGLIDSLDCPEIIVLLNGRQRIWMMTGEGNHRCYLAHLHGMENILARVVQVVDRDKVDKWPNVKNGTFDRSQAQRIFDLIWAGKNPIGGLL